MAVLKKKDKTQIENRLAKEMKDDVKLVLFISEDESKCHYCNLTKEVLEEVSLLSDGKITVEIHVFEQEQELAKEYGVEYVPGVVILDKASKDYNIIFHGAPFGHEFATLLEDIIVVSNGTNPPVSKDVADELKKIKTPVKIQAFVTPTCPYCPKAVLMAHFFAMINPEYITGEMVEASEFPELSAKYGVSSVPQMVINDGESSFVGAYPEREYLEEVMKVVK